MIATYLVIAQAIHETVKGIHWVDLDKGQLDNPEQYNSLIVPSVLIGQSDINWSQLAGGYQQGEGSLTIKVIFQLPVQTHLTDPLVAKTVQGMFDKAFEVGSAVLDTPGVISRINSKDYPVLTYYVIEQTYLALFKSGPVYTPKTVALQINPFLVKPATA